MKEEEVIVSEVEGHTDDPQSRECQPDGLALKLPFPSHEKPDSGIMQLGKEGKKEEEKVEVHHPEEFPSEDFPLSASPNVPEKTFTKIDTVEIVVGQSKEELAQSPPTPAPFRQQRDQQHREANLEDVQERIEPIAPGAVRVNGIGNLTSTVAISSSSPQRHSAMDFHLVEAERVDEGGPKPALPPLAIAERLLLRMNSQQLPQRSRRVWFGIGAGLMVTFAVTVVVLAVTLSRQVSPSSSLSTIMPSLPSATSTPVTAPTQPTSAPLALPSQVERYDCSLPGLSTLTPGMHEGVTANYLSFATETSSSNLASRALEIEACTGGKIVFSEAQNIWEDPIHDLVGGTGLYDGYLMSYSHFPEASALGLAEHLNPNPYPEHLNDRIGASNARLQFEDMLPKVQRMGEFRANGEANMDMLMYDGDFFVPVLRLDLLEKHNLSIPNTWTEVVELAKYFNGTDLNNDGDPNDIGFCFFPQVGAGHWDQWWTEAVYSTWATFEQTEGVDQGFFFDENTMEPRIGEGFRKAAEIWKELWTRGTDACSGIFATGRCAIGFAPGGCWDGIFRNKHDGISRKDESGTVVWKPTFKSGKYAEPYRFKTFGSTQVIDSQSGTFKDCTRELCPKAERIPLKGHHGDWDRAANVTASSPLAGKLINRAPFYWSGGLGTLIRMSSAPEKKDLLWDFFVYSNSAETSVYDVANYQSWLDPWRYSHLFPGNNFLDAGWSQQAYEEHAAMMQWALSAESNGALNLCIPGIQEYTHETVGKYMSQYITGSIASTDLVKNVKADWMGITEAYGKLAQLEIYRASLNLDSLSTFDMCNLHRAEMDKQDPSVCRIFDQDGSNTSILVIAIAVPTVIILLGLGLCSFLTIRKRSLAQLRR